MTLSLYRKLADMAVAGLEIQAGQFVEIRGDAAMWNCIEAVSLAVERAKAVPCLNVTSIAHEAERIRTLPIDWLRSPSPFLLDLATRADAAIVIERDWRPLTESCPSQRLEAWNRAVGVLLRQQESGRVPNCMIAHPGAVPQDELLVPRGDIHRAMENSIDVDMIELDRRVRSVKQIIENGSVLDIRTPNGGRLECQLGGRPVFENDGRLSDSFVLNLPFGAISFTVPETTVQGSICIERWRNVHDLTLTFVDGRISGISAANSPKSFTNFIATHSGHRDRISHVGIGVNPGIHSPTGNIGVDECKSGMLFFALGENRYLGGLNESTLNMDLTCPGATVFVGSRCIVRDGRLTLAS
ncbi:MAG: hypothetical protein OXH11_09960 [Candidatus Aminicenantes bacterium]|nr:hypothetical protein [Candidatus Aminicenantes bacterium]